MPFLSLSGAGVKRSEAVLSRIPEGTYVICRHLRAPAGYGASVSSFSNGNFVVTWESYDQDGSLEGVYGQLFDGNGITLGNEFQVNTYTTDRQISSSVASFSNGDFVVVWSNGQDGSEWGVYGQLFDSTLITSSTVSRTSEMPTSFSSTVLSNTSNPPSSSTYVTTISSSSNSANSTSSQPNSSTSGIITNSSSNWIRTTSNQLSSTSPPTSTSIPTTTFTTTTEETAVSGNLSALWIGLGAGILLCLGLTGGVVAFILKKRKRIVNVSESESESGSFELPDVVKTPHKEIGRKYFQLSKVTKEEAEDIYCQTGYLISFPESAKKIKHVIGEGNFGAIKVAQRIKDDKFVVSKKVKGKAKMKQSEREANLQKDAAGTNILPIHNTIKLEDALYHFMPLAGYGNGAEIQSQLSIQKDCDFVEEIITFVAQDILTGLKTIHEKSIFHLDIKPENIVFDKDGTCYVTDFGCAKRVEKGETQITWKAIGDNRYFSPERYQSCMKSDGVFDGGKADVWAAGKTLFQMITDFHSDIRYAPIGANRRFCKKENI